MLAWRDIDGLIDGLIDGWMDYPIRSRHKVVLLEQIDQNPLSHEFRPIKSILLGERGNPLIRALK